MTTTTTDKATARPWKLHLPQNSITDSGDDEALICQMYDSQFITPPEQKANAALIVQAVNEYAALKAVAEAAEHLTKEMAMAFDDVPAGVDAWLATVRTRLAHVCKSI